MTVSLDPIWSAEADGIQWCYYWHKNPAWRDQVLAWMRDNGMDETQVHSVDVYLMDAPYAVTGEYVRDENGAFVVVGDEVAQRTGTYPLTSYPPPWPEDD